MQARALITPRTDFWLLGGLSVLGLAALWGFTTWFKPGLTPAIMWGAYCISFTMNFPHFMYSYQLMYNDFWHHLRSPETSPTRKVRLVFAGLIVPVILLGFFIQVGIQHSSMLLGCGLAAYMFLALWHYVKQGYGALITMSVYKKIFYSALQKYILLANAYIACIYTWVRLNDTYASIQRQYIYDTPIAALHFPAWCLPLCEIAVCISSLLAAVVIFYVWKIEKKGITFNGIMGYCAACYIWVIALSGSNLVLIAAVPFFHSLQYMPFVFKFKRSEIEDQNNSCSDPLKKSARSSILLLIFALTGVALGVIFFYSIPAMMDKLHGPWGGGFTNYFFVIAFLIFINIHHFFIDNVFWRKDNTRVQKFLFAA